MEEKLFQLESDGTESDEKNQAHHNTTHRAQVRWRKSERPKNNSKTPLPLLRLAAVRVADCCSDGVLNVYHGLQDHVPVYLLEKVVDLVRMRFYEHLMVHDKRPGGHYDRSKDDPMYKPLFDYYERRKWKKENSESKKLVLCWEDD
jgi:hypothetical protein